MLACVCQPSESKLYKGGVVTPLVHLGGQRPPRRPPGSVKPRPPKPPPKPQSASTSSEESKSSPTRNSSKNTPPSKSAQTVTSDYQKSENSHNHIIIEKEFEENKCPDQSKIVISEKRKKSKGSPNFFKRHDFKFTKESKSKQDIPIPHKIIRNHSSLDTGSSDTSEASCNGECPGKSRRHSERSIHCIPKGNQEKLLKTKNDTDKRTNSNQRNDQEVNQTLVDHDMHHGGVVTITDNDGKIYCVDNLILVAEDVFSKIKNEDYSGEERRMHQNTSSRGNQTLTVKCKSESGADTLSADGTKSYELPEGVELTLGELRAMALRQQQQIDCQHQLLAAREQRLRFLKQQEARHHQVAAENERLRRLRERVEAQELKLRRLRALRGQLDQTNINNVALTSDLESIRLLFNEKEKELSVAVAKVEELTRQLEEVRRGRGGRAAPRAPPRPHPPAALELDKLRRELMYRNKLNEQQNARLSQQREALTARQAEMASIDQRISELQGRLQRKRVANRQLATQITQQHHNTRATNPATVQLSNYPNPGSGGNPLLKGQIPRGNVAAVEPYNHIPHPQNVTHNFQALKHNAVQNNLPMKIVSQTDALSNHITQQDGHYLQQKQFANQLFNNGSYPQRLQANLLQTETQFNPSYPVKQSEINAYQQGLTSQHGPNDQKILLEHINKYNIDLQKTVNHNQNVNNNNNIPTSTHNSQQTTTKQKTNDQEFLPEFTASKSDPKYQTLPYNTKFTANGTTKTNSNKQFYDDNSKIPNESSGIIKVSSSSNVNNLLTAVSGSNTNHMTAHSTPLTINKGLATPLMQNDGNTNNGFNQENSSTYHIQKSESWSKCSQEEKENQRQGEQQPKVVGEQYKVPQGGRAELVRGFSQQNTATSTGQIKPVSSVAPTSVQVSSGKPSPIYQTSSTKIQPVQPQTVANTSPNTQPSLPKSSSGQNSSIQSLLLSPPQSSSTPTSTPDASSDKSVPRPTLPPKPAPKLQTNAESTPSQPHHQQNTSAEYKNGESTLPPVPTSDPPSEQDPSNSQQTSSTSSTDSQQMIIKARPLTIRKQPLSEQPKLKSQSNNVTKNNGVNVATTRRIEMPAAFLFPEMEQQQDNSQTSSENNIQSKNVEKSNKSMGTDVTDRAVLSAESSETSSEELSEKNGVSNLTEQMNTVDLSNVNGDVVSRRVKKGNLKQSGKVNLSRRVSFDPLALLLDASLEGELELVKKTATQVANPSAANDEGITALHNAICAGHFEIVKFLVEFGCDVNAQDSDGWTPLHCAASCNNVAMVRFLVENGACIFATTLSDHETAAQKCEEDEEGFDGCSEYLYSVQEKLGIMNGGAVYAVFPYSAHEVDELSFIAGARLSVLRKGDDAEREWWWAHNATGQEGYVPRNLLGLYPRVTPKPEQ